MLSTLFCVLTTVHAQSVQALPLHEFDHPPVTIVERDGIPHWQSADGTTKPIDVPLTRDDTANKPLPAGTVLSVINWEGEDPQARLREALFHSTLMAHANGHTPPFHSDDGAKWRVHGSFAELARDLALTD